MGAGSAWASPIDQGAENGDDTLSDYTLSVRTAEGDLLVADDDLGRHPAPFNRI